MTWVYLNGIQLLGMCVGTEEYRQRFLSRKVDAKLKNTAQVLRLPRQAAFPLLCECVFPTLLHLLRCLDSTGLDEQWGGLPKQSRIPHEPWMRCLTWTIQLPPLLVCLYAMAALAFLNMASFDRTRTSHRRPYANSSSISWKRTSTRRLAKIFSR